ncbi:hypothetical protein RO3G_14406 [Rhizopus delemar RA 99-880]|uniref:Coronin n=1 Tax=Rhizopus delemar (strain RA 99-880 / ATCC MYA-4621 / FGSC 9543 / NRRL 43880) TaxID=246409 RepID=I1CML5_RHIO9|nr:hypothetical protein RO3G_14406 [Rhizopus delemar RA 99-880]|eukprot:EIE89695.1 hypothetical protein RO3G_14406 [Rhizopus delemar RA 99-880]
MAFFVRPSKYRHVYGTCAKRDFCYDNIRVSANAWDTNMIKVNPRFISINWQASGGGAFAVLPLSQVGKLPDNYPLYRGHTAPVLDTDFNPFNDFVIASGSEDSKVMIWSIPEEYVEGQEEVTPILKLSGHGRKVGQVLFHPVAENVLASASTDLTIKLWDVEKGTERQQITGHTEIIQSMSWNYNGSLLATTCRDKKLRIFDVRANKVVQEGPGHQGIKGSRVVWMGNTDRLATTGFSRMSDRQLNLWDTSDLSKPLKSEFLDTSSGVIMPFYDSDSKMLYLAGKGDGNIRYYEYDNDELYPLSEFKAADPQRGMGFMPKRGLNVNECEVARAFKVGTTLIEPISFTVPRKSDAFQSDIFPPCLSDEPALTADEWFEGKDADPKLVDLEAGFTAKAKKEFVPTAAPVEEYQEAYHEARKENEELKGQLSQRDVKIRVLEIEVEKLRTELAELSVYKAKEETEGELPHSANALVE